MAELTAASASIRLTNEEGRSICFVNNVLPTVTAETAAAFVDAIETLYNNGECAARMNIAYDIVS